MDNQVRRILCIDGGGLKGAFPAGFLGEIERHLGQPVGDYFDLITGTSTGGLLALGLGLGVPASRISDLYREQGPAIFGQHHNCAVNWALRRFRWLRQWVISKYSSERLRVALEHPDVLGDSLIGESKRRLVIPAWDATRREVYIFKTAHHERLRTDYKAQMVDAALATAAAPTYFDEHLTDNNVGMIDGGIWANNPIAVAVVEALTLLDWEPEQLRILSLGCLDEAYRVPKNAGIGRLGGKITNLFMDGQSHSSMGIAKLLTGDEYERKAIWRIDKTVPRNVYKMDDADRIRELEGLGHSVARERFAHLKETFFMEPAPSFTPRHQVGRRAK